MTETPWRGILTATALPFDADGAVDYARYADHVDWLVRNGSDGVVCNGSLGEYQTLTHDERAKVVETAVAGAQHRHGAHLGGAFLVKTTVVPGQLQPGRHAGIGGLDIAETAEALGVGTATVEVRTSVFQARVGSTRAEPMSLVGSICTWNCFSSRPITSTFVRRAPWPYRRSPSRGCPCRCEGPQAP